MAVTGLDFSLPTIKQRNHDPAFIIMDRRSIDLNKHAFDLNEIPLNEFSLDFHDASSSHELGNSLLPKKGGWLELFRNMFGQDKVVLGGFPFAGRMATSNSSCNNNFSQADERQHSDPRVHSSQALQSDERQQSDTRIPSSQNLHNRSRKLPIFDEFNHGNIFNTLPISEHADTGSHAGKSFFNVPGQPGCTSSFLTSLYPTAEGVKLNAGVVQQGCDALGRPQHIDGVHTSFRTSPEQGSVGSSISHGFNHYKAPVPVWDLNSRPIPQWSADLQPIEISKAPCIPNSRLFSQHSGKSSTESQAQVMENVENWGPCPHTSDALLKKIRQENGFSELEKDIEQKNGLLCSGNGGPHSNKGLESTNGENLPLTCADKGKGQDLRVRIIESPDWLPAGWITEVKTRMTGSTAGTTDKYYKEPVTGRRFRSKNEVLNFLQTGRLCRNKPQIKLLDGFAATLPLLLPRPEQHVRLPDSFQAVAANRTSLRPAYDLSSQVSMRQSLCPPSVILNGISVKQEPEDLIQGGLKMGGDAYLGELNTYNLQGRPCLEVPEIEKSDLSIHPGASSACFYQKPVHSNKRKLAGDHKPSKRFCSTVNELQDQDKWIFCMSAFPREAGAQAVSTQVGAIDTGIAHTHYPGLLHKQETNGVQDAAVTPDLAARYKANSKALGLYERPIISSTSQLNLGCIKELRPKTGFLSKFVEKKPQKLTLKQERDLFVSLGRRLCQEFLTSSKESCLQ